MTLVLVVAGVLGLAIGSFANVVIHRVPLGMSVVRPRSACPGCGTAIGARDNVPLVSWLVLRGRCRACGNRISVRYPLVELGTAALFVVTVVRFGLDPFVVPALVFAAISVCLTMIDLDVRRLPDVIVLPAYPILLVLLTVLAATSGDLADLVRAVIAGAALFAFYFLVMFLYPRGMGFGDVKLSGLIGLMLGYVGWGTFAVGVFASFLTGGLFAIGLLVAGRATRGTSVPFGPWMLLGAWLGLFFGEPVWASYLSLVGLA